MWTRQARRLLVPRPHGAARRWSHGAHGPQPRAVRVVDVARETADAVTVQIAPEDGRPLAFRAGQYLTHLFPVDGAVHKRAYSLSSAEGASLAFTAKLIPGGRVSAFLVSALKAGDRYTVLGPSGDFVLGHGDAPLRCVAGGSGITPVVSLIETALARQPQRDVQLIYASRDEPSIIFRARLARLCAEHPSLRVTHVLSRPQDGWDGERGRLDASRLRALLTPVAGADAYVCGPTGLMDAAGQAWRDAGGDARRLHRERFLAAPQPATVRPVAPQPIEFSRSGRRVTQRVGETILEAALREGVTVDFSCTVGGCGSCKLRVTSGQIAHNEPNCLSNEERAAGWALTCSAYALEPLRLDA